MFKSAIKGSETDLKSLHSVDWKVAQETVECHLTKSPSLLTHQPGNPGSEPEQGKQKIKAWVKTNGRVGKAEMFLH